MLHATRATASFDLGDYGGLNFDEAASLECFLRQFGLDETTSESQPAGNSRKRKVGSARSSTGSLPAEDVSLLEVRPKKRKINQDVAPEKTTRILLSNVRSIRQPANYGHLCMQIENIQPDAVALNETWLTESTG